MGALARGFLSALLAAGSCLAAAGDSRTFTSSDGVRLHYVEQGRSERGTGEALVFVPGWLMPAEIWRRQIDHFAHRYRVIAFDPRSQGDSEIATSGNSIGRRAEDLHELIEQVHSNRVVLIGWSLGALESLLYVKTHGDAKVAALVLVDNSVGEAPGQDGGTVLPDRKGARDLEMADFVHAIFKTPQPPDYLAWLARQALRTPASAGASLLAIPYTKPFWRSAVHGTRKPLLYAVTATLKRQAATLQRNRRDTAVEVFEGAGHALFVDEAARFNAAVDAFLDKALKG